eukprot:CAMPEP_0178741068 /NCGR_PEP_ID=MMETSP0744-20121128/4929_1 /TAXON_ID=913974 /ORGANISM="Nitzschia punctata, Strain CCMP561" /LENGTH=246 /DNA_ID=CAMNT_0020393889 /DNA_START=169 /DNA_END=907 /DNA_ORIENTATION=-
MADVVSRKTTILQQSASTIPASTSSAATNATPPGTFVTTVAAAMILLGVATPLPAANAACLPGDLRPECIGVYKVPMDDQILPYVGTKEALQKFAPDLEYVPPMEAPKSLPLAIDLLQAQQVAAKDVQQKISAGKLEEAGVEVLKLIPQLTSSGRYIVSTIDSRLAGGGTSGNVGIVDELKKNMIENQLNTAIALWGECDVMIGQGMRGDMGVSAAAQIQILSSLREACSALDDFIVNASTLLEST